MPIPNIDRLLTCAKCGIRFKHNEPFYQLKTAIGNFHKHCQPMPNEQHTTGAVRQKLYERGLKFPLRYDLLFSNEIGLRRLAEVFGEGYEKYGANNWKKGFPESVMINHCLEHIRLYLAGDTTEDHVGHAMWNLYVLAFFQEKNPELMDLTHKPYPVQPTEPEL